MNNKQHTPTDTRDQAVQIRDAWNHLGRSLTYGDLSVVELETMLAQMDKTETEVNQLEEQLATARNAYVMARKQVWSMVKRARSGVKAKYGDDSFEYERFGGTPMSARRRRRPAAKPEPV